jgi:hypothetical protein
MSVGSGRIRAKELWARHVLSRAPKHTEQPGRQEAPSPQPLCTPGANPSPEQQATFFRTFGALKVPGLFTAEIGKISEGFDETFSDTPFQEVNPAVSLHKVMDPDHGTPRRQITTGFIERTPKLEWLKDDPRVTNLAHALLGDGYTYNGSTGNMFNSYIYWHSDYFRSEVSPNVHLKFAFYLDQLDADCGALRVIPGTNHLGAYRESLYDEARRDKPGSLEQVFGVGEDELPCWVLSVEPGDLVVFNHTTLHANFNGGSSRRMFSLQYAEAAPPGYEDAGTSSSYS